MNLSTVSWSPSPDSLLSAQTIYFLFSLWTHGGRESNAMSCVHQSVFTLLYFIYNFNPQIHSPTKFFCSSAQVTSSSLSHTPWFCHQNLSPLYIPLPNERSFPSLWQSAVKHICTVMQKREKSYRDSRATEENNETVTDLNYLFMHSLESRFQETDKRKMR